MDPFKILQVKPGASREEIQQTYRDLVRVWHPDRFANDARLQRIAEEKLRQINDAYAAIQEGAYQNTAAADPAPPPPPPPPPSPHPQRQNSRPARHRGSHVGFFIWLTLIAGAVFGLARAYFFLTAPMRDLDRITGDARRVAIFNEPKLTDAFEGWNGNLPSGLSDLLRFYKASPPQGAEFDPAPSAKRRGRRPLPTRELSPAMPTGIGEIQVHNRTAERALATLVAKNNSAPRRFWVAPDSDALLDELGPAIYYVDVSFPDGQRPPMRVGPFVMIETETARQKQGDRYEITLRPQGR